MMNELSEDGTLLFEVVIGADRDLICWVSADSSLQAIELVQNDGILDDADPMTTILAQVCSEERLATAVYHDDDGVAMPMVDAWLLDTEPRVVAVSEW